MPMEDIHGSEKLYDVDTVSETPASTFMPWLECRSLKKVSQRWKWSCSVVSDSLQPRELVHGNSPGQNTGVCSLSLLQGIFPTQRSNPGLPHCRQLLYQLSYKGSPRILEWVAYPFSSGSSWPRNWTGASCIAGRFFTNWAMREGPFHKCETDRSNQNDSLHIWQGCVPDLNACL